MKDLGKPIIFFDGVCNLCNSSVQWIIKRDKNNQFLFAAIQGKTAAELLPMEIQKENPESVMLLENGKLYTHSDAALRITALLGFPYRILYFFWIVPRFIRDGIYRYIANNRYRWFGKKSACMIPTPDIRARFPDQM